jgi:hypothetical protein
VKDVTTNDTPPPIESAGADVSTVDDPDVADTSIHFRHFILQFAVHQVGRKEAEGSILAWLGMVTVVQRANPTFHVVCSNITIDPNVHAKGTTIV